jgi:deoxycytidine triphosphate deaminase
MSVLIKAELIELAKNHELLGTDYAENNFEPCSYDLRMGTAFQHEKIYRKNKSNEGFTNTIVIKPSEIVTFLTLEIIKIPNDCIGTVFAINSLSSTGLLILNPGHIDPGFKGPISICAINLSKEERRISIGDKIFTLVLQKLTAELHASEVYKSKFTDLKTREEEFNKNTALQLSNSFFDLISTYKGTPYFKEQVLEVIKSQLNKAYLIVAGIVTAIVVVSGILVNIGVIALNNPFKWSDEKKIITARYDSLFHVNSNFIKKLEADNIAIKDSLKAINKRIH